MASQIIINMPGYPFTNLTSVETIPALRALPSTLFTNGQNIAVDGTGAVGDGGGGLYTWDDLSVADDDGISVIKPTDVASLAAGRWILTGTGAYEGPDGANSVGWIQAGTGAAATTVLAKLRRYGPHVDDFSGTTLERIKAALAAAVSENYLSVEMAGRLYTIPSDELSNAQIFRPANVALVGKGRNLTTLQVTGSDVTNTLFQADNVSNVYTRHMTIIGNSVGDEDAVSAGAMMIAAIYPPSTPGKVDPTEDMTDIIFEDCDIENFQTAATFLINNRGSAYAMRRIGSRRCNWRSRPGNTIWPGRITVPNHFMYFDGILGPVREPVLDDYVMDAYYIKGGATCIGDVRGAGEIMRLGALLNAGVQNHNDDPTWAISDAENALDGNPPGSGRGDVGFLFYKHATNPLPPRHLTLQIGDVENCVGAHIQVQGGDNIFVEIGRPSGMADTQNASIPKGVFALNSVTNFTGIIRGKVANCKRIADISMDGGANLAAVANANINLQLGFIASMAAVTDVKIDLAGTAFAGGVTISGERTGAAQFGVDLRPDATHGLQDIDLSGFKNNGADYAERWGTGSSPKMQRVTSGANISGTVNDILGQGTTPNTSDMLVADPTVTTDSLPDYPGVQRIGRQSQPLTDAATITPDFGGPRAGGGNFHLTLGGNRTLANPTNIFAGQSGSIRLTQDGTGSRTLAYGSAWKFPGGAPTLSTAAGAVDVINYYVHTSSLIEASIGKALA